MSRPASGRADEPDERTDPIEGAKAGDADAWRALYEEHVDRVVRFVARMGVGSSEVDDVAQEVFVVVFRRLADFDPQVPFRSWLYGIALRIVRNHRRHAWKRRLSRLLGLTVDVPAGPEQLLERREAEAELDWILLRMDEKKRAVFVLREIEGLEMRVVARIVDCPVETAWSRLRHARHEFEGLAAQRRGA